MARALILFQPRDGGVAEYAGDLALSLPERGYGVEVAGPMEAAPYELLEDSGVRVHRLPLEYGMGHPLRDVAALRRLVPLLRHGRFDLIHCLSARAGVLGRIAAALTRTPAVYHPHCYTFVGDMSPARRAVGVAIERALSPVTALTICSCQDERAIALRNRVARPDRIAVVLNGCPDCAPEPAADPELAAMAAEGPLAVAILSLRRQKTVHVLIDAVPRVLAAVPEARVAIVGNGPLHDELVAQATGLGLAADPRFRMLPFRRPAARYLKAADLYVLPSGWEGFPISVLEALACGVPQVATDVGGTSESVVDATGILVPPYDPDALADAMIRILGDPERREEMARASRARHAAMFRLDLMVEGTARAYDRVLSPPGRR